MKYSLLAIILCFSTFANAQKIWDKEAYSKMCDEQLIEVLAHTYELVINGKLDAYQNDSMVSKIEIDDLIERFSVEWISNIFDYRYPNDPYAKKDTLWLENLNPRIDLLDFGVMVDHSKSTDRTINNTLGINLLHYHNYTWSTLDCCLHYLCAIKWQDLITVLSTAELDVIQAYIQTANIEGINTYLNRQEDSIEISYRPTWSSKKMINDKNQIRITKSKQNAISTYWFYQYINAAKLASLDGKVGYKDANLNAPFDNLEKALLDTFVTDEPKNEWPEFVLYLDTLLTQQFNWQTEQIAWFKTPKGEFVIGFKADLIWFYMKLEDVLPYLPKEVLPSLELLKKEI